MTLLESIAKRSSHAFRCSSEEQTVKFILAWPDIVAEGHNIELVAVVSLNDGNEELSSHVYVDTDLTKSGLLTLMKEVGLDNVAQLTLTFEDNYTGEVQPNEETEK